MPLLLAALLSAAAPALGPIEAEPLAGPAVRVPGELPGKPAILLVAFERARADQLDRAWQGLLPLEREQAGLVAYQAPVIGEVNAVLRAVILTSQRLGVPKDRHARYLPLFADRKKIMGSLGVSDPHACLALVARDAAIVAVLTDACAPDLPARVRTLLAPTGAAPVAPAGAPGPAAAPLPSLP
ncbi:MAG: hypothetical protein IT383_02405 [Deltaproteobacteria bacterium]|nr:hypothetical protein [Deltaproteobacteria bacterium]